MATKTGTPNNDLLVGTSSVDALYGLAGNDTLQGKGGADTLDGGTGADSMDGAAGNDTYIVDNIGDIVFEASAQGTDTVEASVSYSLSANVEKLILTGTALSATGNTLANTLTGNNADNILDGGIGADTMKGGLGNDTYYVDNTGDAVTESSGQGTDTIVSSFNYTLGNNLENLRLTGTALTATGNSLNNRLNGNSLNNTLDAKGGDDTLDGGAGADSMTGGAGNDTYFVDNSADSITESSGGGTDTVNSSINYTLGNNLENLTLSANALNATGNSSANILTGNELNNLLDGKAGADNMAGGAGDDTYVVGEVGDTVTEFFGNGVDTVRSSVNYILGSALENLVLENGAVAGTGNELDNRLTGNNGDNTLEGLAGDDVLDGGKGTNNLFAGDGNDTVIAGKGWDFADGGLGEDTLVFDLRDSNAASSIHIDAYSSGDGNYQYYIDAFHSPTNNQVNANGFEHVAVIGGSGNDTINASVAGETLDGGKGNDDIDAGDGNDIVRAGQGRDTVSGDFGDDTLIADFSASSQDLQVGSNLQSMNDPWMGAQIYGDIHDQFGNSISAGGFEHVQIIGGAGNDVINGGMAGETIDGGEGSDNLFGGDGDDTIITGRGNDWTDGGNGEDSLRFDLSHTAESADISVYAAGDWDGSYQYNIDVFNTPLSQHVSGNNFEHLEIIAGSGNDRLWGSIAGEILDGGKGDDQVDGADGNDTIIAGRGMDTVFGGIGHGDEDTLIADFSASGQDLQISSNLQSMNDPWMGAQIYGDIHDQFGNSIDAAGFEHVQIVGGAGNDVINGGSAGETIDGGAGFDNIFSGDGNDTVVAGQGNDFADGGNGEDTLRFDLSAGDTPANISVYANNNWDGSYQYNVDVFNVPLPTHVSGNNFEHLEIIAGSGNDTIWGSAAAEILDGGKGDDQVDGADGNDTIIAGQGMDMAFGGIGQGDEDTLIADFSASGQNLQIGSNLQSMNDPWMGVEIYGDIHDQFGNVINAGGFEHVQIIGGAGDDSIDGGAADETIDGGAGTNTLFGGNGSDTVVTGQGWDFADGGEGEDTLRFDLSHMTTSANINIFAYSNWEGSYQYNVDVFNLPSPQHVTGNSFEHLEVIAGSGDDTVWGSVADETLNGGAGDDSIDGGEGSDIIIAGSGLDMVHGGWGLGDEDSLIADFGASTQDLQITSNLQSFFDPGLAQTSIFGNLYDQFGNSINADGFEHVRIIGGAGNDIVNGGSADEAIDGGAGFDHIFSGDGNDTVIAGQGNDWADGGNGEDTLRFDLSHTTTSVNINVYAYANWDGSYQYNINTFNAPSPVGVSASYFEHFEISGGSGDDFIYGSIASETFDGGGGNDWIEGREGDDLIDGGLGNDWIFGNEGNDTVVAGQGWDTVDGGPGGDNTLIADFSTLTGDLVIQSDSSAVFNSWGFSYNASISDEFGNGVQAMNFEHIEIIGGAGDDVINGGSAAETITGGGGDDQIFANEADDTVVLGKGWDFADGGNGDDTLRFDFGQSSEAVTLNVNFYFNGSTSQYSIDAAGQQSFAHADAYAFEHFEVIGGAGNDTINGSVAAETLKGAAGDDRIFGGMGADTLSGDAGRDYFSYSNPNEGSAGEWIADFSLGANGDVLDLSGLSSANPGFTADAQHLSFSHVDTNSDGLTDYTSVGVDLDGGANHFVTLVNLQGVSMSLDNWENLIA